MRPSAAERARTAVALARVGAVTTYPRLGRPCLTSACVREQAGCLVLRVPTDGEVSRTLQVRPLATVRVAPLDGHLVALQGRVRRLGALPDRQETEFLLEPGAVRTGSTCSEGVDADAYRAAAPDPLRELAPGVLEHLRREHPAAFADCLRVAGHDRVQWAEATGLDRYGLDLTVVDDDGVVGVRLDFPAPVQDLRGLAPQLLATLCGQCERCWAHAGGQRRG